MTNGGIFGPKLSGKSTLAMKLSRGYFEKAKMRSLVLDPHLDSWGEQAFVTADEELFWANVWKTKGSLIIVDEAAATIKRSRDLIPVFTKLRHNHHKLIVIGHSGVDLLPTMRQQIDTLYLFRQSKKAADIWSEVMTEPSLEQAVTLNQYEFLFHEMYKKPSKRKLKL